METTTGYVPTSTGYVPTFRDYIDLSVVGVHTWSPFDKEGFKDFLTYSDTRTRATLSAHDLRNVPDPEKFDAAIREISSGSLNGIPRDHSSDDVTGLAHDMGLFFKKKALDFDNGYYSSPCSLWSDSLEREVKPVKVSPFFRSIEYGVFVDTFTGNEYRESFYAWVRYEDGQERVAVVEDSLNNILADILPPEGSVNFRVNRSV